MVSYSFIDEPGVLANLEGWRAYLEGWRALPDDDVTKIDNIIAAEGRIRVLQARAAAREVP